MEAAMTPINMQFRALMTVAAACLSLGVSAHSKASERVTVPTKCAKANAGTCVPTKSEVKSLCRAKNQDVALRMFKPGTPWKRLHLRQPIETRYSGSRYAKAQQMQAAEQVLVLADRATQKGGMTVSGYGNYDVLRFNGHCTTVMASDLLNFRPTTPDFAPMQWKRTKLKTRKALTKSKAIAWRASQRASVCRTYGKRSVDCDAARIALSRIVVEKVRKGQKLPELK
jgi:hypothetical protein